VDAFLLLSVAIVAVIAAAFAWSVGTGQFDDLDGEAHRILVDDDKPVPGPVDAEREARDP
jgi:cbb3-type cytochrome oxidase maturation protein